MDLCGCFCLVLLESNGHGNLGVLGQWPKLYASDECDFNCWKSETWNSRVACSKLFKSSELYWMTNNSPEKRQRFLSRRVVTWIQRIWLRIHILTARFYQQRARFFRINLESKGWEGSTTNTVKNRDQGFVTVSFGVAWVMDRKAWSAKTHGKTSFGPRCRYFSLRFLRLTSLDGRLLDSKKTLEEESIEDGDSISAIVQTPRSLWLLKMFEAFLWISRNMWRQLQ